jgi:hypothetical protein
MQHRRTRHGVTEAEALSPPQGPSSGIDRLAARAERTGLVFTADASASLPRAPPPLGAGTPPRRTVKTLLSSRKPPPMEKLEPLSRVATPPTLSNPASSLFRSGSGGGGGPTAAADVSLHPSLRGMHALLPPPRSGSNAVQPLSGSTSANGSVGGHVSNSGQDATSLVVPWGDGFALGERLAKANSPAYAYGVLASQLVSEPPPCPHPSTRVRVPLFVYPYADVR